VIGIRLALAALLATPGALSAQQPTTSPAPTAADPIAPVAASDSLVPFERPNGALLRPGVAVYDLALVRGGERMPLGIRTVQVSESAPGGSPGWLIAESRTGTVVPTTDSLWVLRADLTPLRWAATIDRSQLAVAFTRDSAFGAVQSYRGRTSFATTVPPNALITSGMLERVIELLPLRDGYRAGAALLLFDLGTPRALDAEVMVERTERVRVGSSEVDCWVVALRAGVMEQRLWVTRDAPRVVRSEQTLPNGVLTASLLP
jgi:hypothetical protein